MTEKEAIQENTRAVNKLCELLEKAFYPALNKHEVIQKEKQEDQEFLSRALKNLERKAKKKG